MLGELWARPVPRVAEARVSFVYPGLSHSPGWVGVCTGTCLGQIPRVPHQGAGQGVSKARVLLRTGLGSTRVTVACRLCVFQDDQYYHFLAVPPSIYAVNKLH